MSKRIVISGYYGFGNTGDEAVLEGILATLREIVDARITVFSADPERTMSEHPDVRSVHRYRITQVLREMRKADLVISGGGSLLQDVTSARSSYYYLGILRLAQILKRKTTVYAQGIGPLNSERIRSAVARTLNKVDAISVRDEDSKTLLESIGVNRIPVHLSADPAFLVSPDYEAADRVLAANGLSGRKFIGLSLRPWPRAESWLDEIAEGSRIIADELGMEVALIPMQEPRDTEVLQSVKSGVLLREIGSLQAVKGVIGRSSLMIGMRLHCLIFAASEGVPFVPIVYDPKVASFAAAMGQPRGVDVASVNSGDMVNAVRLAWGERTELAERLSAKASESRMLALRSGELADRLLRQ